VDVIERRVAWIAVSDAIVLFFATSGGLAYGLAGLGTWELVFFIAAIVCLGATAALLVSAMVPAAVHAFDFEERERLVFAALALWALAIVMVVGLVAHGAIEAHQHPNGFGG
jgi:hypothetical protein